MFINIEIAGHLHSLRDSLGWLFPDIPPKMIKDILVHETPCTEYLRMRNMYICGLTYASENTPEVGIFQGRVIRTNLFGPISSKRAKGNGDVKIKQHN